MRQTSTLRTWGLILTLIATACTSGGSGDDATIIPDTAQTTTPPPSPSASASAAPTVQNLTGLQASVARSIVSRDGFTLFVVDRKVTSQPKGEVIFQSPPSGTVEPGSTIEVTVSVGQSTVPSFRSNPFTRGFTVEAATRRLRRARLRFAGVRYVNAPLFSLIEPGRVIGTRPRHGKNVAPGTAVTLLVIRPVVCTPGYSQCLPPTADYDCAGGTGDAPFVNGPIYVDGSDPYGLDGDGNGIGCQ